MKNRMFSSASIIQLLLPLALLIGTPGYADSSNNTVADERTTHERVSYGDLNLQRKAGAQTLYVRLQGAARNVCGGRVYRPLSAYRQWRECYSKALNGAVGNVGNPQVDAIHSGDGSLIAGDGYKIADSN